MWSDGPGRPNPQLLKTKIGHRTCQPGHDIVPGPGQSPQRVRGATSVDGVIWSAPFDIAGDPPEGHGWIARGFWIRDGKLLALASRFQPPEYIGPGLALCTFEMVDGGPGPAAKAPAWKPLGVLLDDALNNFPPQKLPTGEWMMSRRDGKADVSVMIGGIAGFDRWTSTPMVAYAGEGGFKPEEPIWYVWTFALFSRLLK
jgi:hypothetical protein